MKDILSFEMGVFYSVAVLNDLYDQPSMAATILREAGLTNEDCSNLDDYEKEQLRLINKEKGINLKGL